MNERLHILSELNSQSTLLASLQSIQVYTIPHSYFDGLEEAIMKKITTSALGENTPHLEVPIGYFDSLPSFIMQKIKLQNKAESVAEETAAIATVVANIGNHNIYVVPNKYFDTLTVVANKQIGKLMPITLWKKVSKYAAAAVVAGLLGLGIYNYTTQELKLDVAMAEVLKNADEIIKKGSFEAELKTISDTDLENYLTANGDDINAALVATTVNDEIVLPNADDYLIDENTLDDFLKNNNLKN